MRYLYKTLRIVGLSYLGVLLLMMFFENSLIFVPTNSSSDNWSPKGLKFEEAKFQAADGTKLHGWYVPHDNPTAVVLFCHGNSGNITHRVDDLQMLHHVCNASVMIFDYRGFGHSEGSPNERGVLADARAARTWLAKRAGIPESQVVLMGESLGGAVAVDLATDGARGLVLLSTFNCLADVGAYHFPWAPVRWLMRTRLDSASKIKAYHGPVYQSHGDCDTIVPIEFAKKLFAAANEPKKFEVLVGHNHNDATPTSYFDRLAEYLKTLPK